VFILFMDSWISKYKKVNEYNDRAKTDRVVSILNLQLLEYLPLFFEANLRLYIAEKMENANKNVKIEEIYETINIEFILYRVNMSI